MLKNKSLEDVNCFSDEQLFTELTPQEAAAIEGGAILRVVAIEALEVDGGEDALSLTAGSGKNTKVIYEGNVTAKGTIEINETINVADAENLQLQVDGKRAVIRLRGRRLLGGRRVRVGGSLYAVDYTVLG